MTKFIGTDQDGKKLFTLHDGQVTGELPTGLNTYIIIANYNHRKINGEPVDKFPVMDYIITTV